MEMRFYEMIGIRQWKKLVLWFMSKLIPNRNKNIATNYYLGGFNLKAILKYKKWLWVNALLHVIVSLHPALTIIANVLSNNVVSFSMLFAIIFVVLNLYCIMLQRYNWLRIKRVLETAARK